MIFLAYRRALASLVRPGVLIHLLWPTFLAIGLWGAVGVYASGHLIVGLVRLVESLPWVGSALQHSAAAQVALALSAKILLLLLFVPLVFVTSSMLVSVFALPLMLDRVAATDYRDVERREGGTLAGSLCNSMLTLLGFVVLVTLTLPLWWIPGVGVILSVVLSAWMNQRCYRYDALLSHADEEELTRIPRARRGGLWGVGLSASVLGYVPVLNLFVPALTGLAFVHYLLEALRRDRGGAQRSAT